MSSVTTTHAPKGLEGVVATNSKICYIDGDRGVLAYRGIDIHELANHSNFEESLLPALVRQAAQPRRNCRSCKLSLARERKLDASIISIAAQGAEACACPWTFCAPPSRRCRSTIREEKINDAEANVRQGDSPDLADRHDRRRLRPHPQGQAGCRA